MNKEEITKNQAGIDTLISVADELDTSFQLSYSTKQYSYKNKKCTVRIVSRSFSASGDDCLFQAIKGAVKFIVFNFSKFDEVKQYWLAQEAKEITYCEPTTFQITKAQIP